MESRLSTRSVFLGATLALLCGVPQVVGAEESVAKMRIRSQRIRWIPKVEYESILLTVSCPDEEVVRAEFAYPARPIFQLPPQDGSYVYELTVTPRVDDGLRAAMAGARESGDETFGRDLRRAGMMPKGAVQSGHFRVADGGFVTDDVVEERDDIEELEQAHD